MAVGNAFPVYLKVQSDGSAAAFAEFRNQGQAAADDVARHFKGSLDEISRLTSKALSAPRNSFGALNLDTAGLRQASAEADHHAAALRQVAAAAEQLAAKNSQLSGVQQVYVRQSQEAAAQAERDAAALRQKVAIYDQLQQELNETARATGGAASAGRVLNQSLHSGAAGAAAHRQAMVGAGQQLQDMVIGFQSGQRASTIFAQQLPQLAFQLQGVGGAAGRVATFLSGPWGAAIFLGMGAMGALIAQLISGRKSSDDLATSFEKQKLSSHELITAIKELDEATGKQILTSRQSEVAALRDAEAKLIQARGTREAAKAKLQLLEADLAGAQRRAADPTLAGEAGFNAGAVEGARIAGEISTVRAQIAKLDQAIGKTDTSVRRLRVPLLEREVAEGLDAATAATGRYERAQGRLREQLERNAITEAQYRDRLRAAAQQRDRDVKAARDAETAARQATRNVARTVELVAPVTAASGSGFGPRVRPKPGASAFHAGVDYPVPIGTDVRAGAPGVVVHVGKLGGLGQAVVVDYGNGVIAQFGHLSKALVAKGDTVRAGQVVAQSGNTGVSTGPHLHYALKVRGAYVDPLKNRRVKVGSGVGDAVADYEADAAREAEKATGELDSALAALRNRFAATEAAAADYAETLAKIARLESAGRINRDTATEWGAAAMRERMEADRRIEDAAHKAFGETLPADVKKWFDPDALFVPLKDGAIEALVDGGLAGAKAFEEAGIEAAETIASLFSGLIGGTMSGIVAAFTDTRTAEPFAKVAGALARKVNPGLSDLAVAKIGSKVGDAVAGAIRGAQLGEQVGGMLFGRRANATASKVGGAIGGAIGSAVAGPVGEIVGSILGSTAGNLLFPKAIKKGVSNISVTSDGRLVVGSTTGNSGKMKKASVEAAESAITGIERIAEALGATIRPGVGSVSIGVRHGDYRVDTSGRGITKKKKGAVDFDGDATAAVKYATLDLIKDGILGGLRAGTLRLLQNAKDLDLGLEKALRFESVFTELKRRLDPAGAAMDEVGKKFDSLRKLFQDAGASAEEFAKLEELYGLERAEAIKGATEEMTGALRSLLDDLTVNNDAVSLRDRLAMARAKYDPLAADAAAGRRFDADAFAEAARNVESLTRQIEGSGTGYFTVLDRITSLTTKALGEQEKLIEAATKTTPLDTKVGGTNDNAPVVGAIDAMKNAIVDTLNNGGLAAELRMVNTNLGRLISGGGSGSGGRILDGFALSRAGF